jgi:hypothetical protein
MKITKPILLSLLISLQALTTTSVANTQPGFLNETSEQEYRQTVEHLMKMLPPTDNKAVYSPLIRPFGLLDVHPTKFTSVKHKAEFSNFNFGVMGAQLGLAKEDLDLIPNLILCNDALCIDNRIAKINEFLNDAEAPLNHFAQSPDLFLVSQLSDNLYRINHMFISDNKVYEYKASENAGFIPSANFVEHASVIEAPELAEKAEITKALRVAMKKYAISAVIRSGHRSLNIIFNGAGDNQWGVVIGESNIALPKEGDISHLGYAIDKVKAVSDNAFYYQTN